MKMDYNQSNCKNYFNLNTNKFYYEPQMTDLSINNNQSKGLNNGSITDGFINSSDHALKQLHYDTSTDDVVYELMDDNSCLEDFHLLNNRHHPQTFIPNSTYHYPITSNYPSTDHQNEITNSVLLNNDVQQFNDQNQSPIFSAQQSQNNSPQQMTKQLSVNLSMNMTMDIKSTNSSSTTCGVDQSSNYDHMMSGVVNNVANKLVTNFNTNLLSPTNQNNLLQPVTSTQKDYHFYPQSYPNQPTKAQYSIYNSQNSNYHNQRYYNTIHNSTYYATNESNYHFFNHPQHANNSFDEYNQIKHFDNYHNNDCYELAVCQPNWNESNNSSPTNSSLASNLNSLSNSFSNGSFASNDINNNDHLINYSNNFFSSINNKSPNNLDLSTNDLNSSLDSPYKQNKLKFQQLNSLQSYTFNLKNDRQKTYFKYETDEILKRDKQDLNSVLRVRSNENRNDIDLYQINSDEKLDKKIKSINKMNNLCLLCGKSYARPSTLKTHLRTHSNERPYRCLTCLKSFSQAANLTAHLRTHSGEKPFQCMICYRKFSQSSSVTTHMRTHSGERPYRCGLCRKAFSDSSTLTKHLRIHSGEKPYQCQLCQLKFSQSGNLNRHMRIHSFN